MLESSTSNDYRELASVSRTAGASRAVRLNLPAVHQLHQQSKPWRRKRLRRGRPRRPLLRTMAVTSPTESEDDPTPCKIKYPARDPSAGHLASALRPGRGGLPLTSSFHTHLHVKYDAGCTAPSARRRAPFFWKAYLSIKQPLTAHGPFHPQVSSRHDP